MIALKFLRAGSLKSEQAMYAYRTPINSGPYQLHDVEDDAFRANRHKCSVLARFLYRPMM